MTECISLQLFQSMFCVCKYPILILMFIVSVDEEGRSEIIFKVADNTNLQDEK